MICSDESINLFKTKNEADQKESQKYGNPSSMISNNTTLVLGAGASMPYGMPSGTELRHQICQSADDLGLTLNNIVGVDRSTVSNFIYQFSRSSVASIDAFLAKRNEFNDVGKLCIAAILCAKESEGLIYRYIDDHWYHHLWQKLHDGAHTHKELSANRIRIITFNYDRSLEFFLFEAIKNTYGINNAEALETLRKLKILHVYGQLGNFHFEKTSNSRTYHNRLDGESLTVACEGLKIIPESRQDDSIFRTAREWLGDSELIGFLGFGFDPLNVERLGLASVLDWCNQLNRKVPKVIASTFGMYAPESIKIKKMLWPSSWEHITTIDDQSSDTIRRSELLD